MRQRQKEFFPVVGNNILYFFSFASAFFAPFISLSIFYVPFVILLMCIFGGIGNFGVVLSRDYAALATYILMSWAANHLPLLSLEIFKQAIESANDSADYRRRELKYWSKLAKKRNLKRL